MACTHLYIFPFTHQHIYYLISLLCNTQDYLWSHLYKSYRFPYSKRKITKYNRIINSYLYNYADVFSYYFLGFDIIKKKYISFLLYG